jgi:integrase
MRVPGPYRPQRRQTPPAVRGSLDALLGEVEELRMTVSDEQLIEEAVAINHGQVKEETVERYRDHLYHLAAYLDSAQSVSFYSARRRHVNLFMAHLEKPGGRTPHPLRLPCRWCNERGYPDGRGGAGWSASYRKSYLSAARFLYQHFAHEEDLPDIDPTGHIKGPKVVVKPQYTPTREEVQALLDAPGRPRDRLLAYWTFYAPSRRETFVQARWRDIDLKAGTWDLVGKGDIADCFELHPVLAREFRRYRRWMVEQYATRHRPVRDALAYPETAFVLLTYNGLPVRAQTIAKQLKWRARRAGVAVQATEARWDAPGGKTSRLSPHAMRRGWADIALNEQDVPIDVVAEVLNHKDISTTRRHYARTKPERARVALRTMRV